VESVTPTISYFDEVRLEADEREYQARLEAREAVVDHIFEYADSEDENEDILVRYAKSSDPSAPSLSYVSVENHDGSAW
jgi:hypothetical protein